MNPTKAVVILQSIVIICRAGSLIDTVKLKDSSEPLVQATVKIIKTCYETELDAIGIVGSPSDSMMTALLNGGFDASVVLRNGAPRMMDDGPVPLMSRHKLAFFVIMISSSMEVGEILTDIKNARWWNHLANVYIVDWPLSKDGCSRAYETLSTAWKSNLLGAKFMCVDEPKKLMIYSFNPYTSDAPVPWKLKNIHPGENDHPWTLLVREYQDEDNVCVNMDFDKTIDLGGYEISVVIPKTTSVGIDVIVTDENGVHSFGGFYGDLAKRMFRQANATTRQRVGDDSYEVPKDILVEAANKTSDIGFFVLSVMERGMNASSTIYPWRTGGMSVITQYRGYKSQLSKLASVLDWSSRIGVYLVVTLTVIFMKCFLHQTLSTAILNTTRLIFNSCLVKVPIDVGSRIYLSSLFVFVITILGIYQGQLASLLSRRIFLPNVDSLLDLAKYNYTVYANHDMEIYFRERGLRERFVGIDSWNCTKYVLRYPQSTACLSDKIHHINEAARFKLHVSKQTVSDDYVTWVIRHDWPLEQRINKLTQRLVEANLFRYSQERYHEKALRTIEDNENLDKDADARVLTLDDLSFAFAILGFGLSAATLCFVIEIVKNRRGKLSRIVKIQPRRRARH